MKMLVNAVNETQLSELVHSTKGIQRFRYISLATRIWWWNKIPSLLTINVHFLLLQINNTFKIQKCKYTMPYLISNAEVQNWLISWGRNKQWVLLLIRGVKLSEAPLITPNILFSKATPKVHHCLINIKKTRPWYRLIFTAVSTFGHKKISTPKN